MQAETKFFGEIEYDEADVLRFEEGLFGFETERHFILIPFGGSDGALLCLQSLETPGLAFTVMNPFFIRPDYTPILKPHELKGLGVENSQDLCYYVLCVVRQPVSESTVNLKCPVVINDVTRSAVQIMLETNEYEMRHQLSEFRPKGGGAPC